MFQGYSWGQETLPHGPHSPVGSETQNADTAREAEPSQRCLAGGPGAFTPRVSFHLPCYRGGTYGVSLNLQVRNALAQPGIRKQVPPSSRTLHSGTSGCGDPAAQAAPQLSYRVYSTSSRRPWWFISRFKKRMNLIFWSRFRFAGQWGSKYGEFPRPRSSLGPNA